MASKLKVEKPFKNPESLGERSLMFTVLESPPKWHLPKSALLIPSQEMSEVDRVQRVLRK